MSYIVAGVAFGLYVILGKKLGALAVKAWWLRPLMLLIASASAADTALGGLVARVIGGVLGFFGSWIGVSGALVAGAVGLLLLVGTCLDLKDRRPDGMAKVGLIFMPVLALVASGPLAANGNTLFDQLSQAATSALASVIGG